MKLIVGLGNPGSKYKDTRHNAGRMFVDSLRSKIKDNASFGLLSARGGVAASGKRRVLSNLFERKRLKTQTKNVKILATKSFMNQSGQDVRRLLSTFNLPPSNILIVHDDMDLPLGEFKLHFGKSSAGHKGVQSIIDALGTKDFWRLRIGIGSPPEGVSGEEYVLGKFSSQERDMLERLIEKAASAVVEWGIGAVR